MNSKISAIEYYLPENYYDNNCLSNDFPGIDADRIEKRIGVKKRHIAGENQTALDLAYEASLNVFKDFDKDKIDFILLCTQSPDYFLPTSACILQEMLELNTNAGALDFNLGCSGYVYGLALAKGLIKSNVASNILLLTADTYSKHIHKKDRANRIIFGDGAAASIISACENEQIFEFSLGTDGKGKNNLIVPNGGFRSKYDENTPEYTDDNNNIRSKNNLHMNSSEIFNFTIERIPAMVDNVLKKNNMDVDDIDFFIFHQANKYILNHLRKKLKINPDKFYINLTETGNTVSSSIPIALKDCLQNDLVSSSQKIMLCGFGVGYSWASTIIEI